MTFSSITFFLFLSSIKIQMESRSVIYFWSWAFRLPTKICSFFFHRNRIFAGQMVAARYNLRTKSMVPKLGRKKNVCKLRLQLLKILGLNKFFPFLSPGRKRQWLEHTEARRVAPQAWEAFWSRAHSHSHEKKPSFEIIHS